MIAHSTDLFTDHDITIASAEPKLIPVRIVSFLYDILQSLLYFPGLGVQFTVPVEFPGCNGVFHPAYPALQVIVSSL